MYLYGTSGEGYGVVKLVIVNRIGVHLHIQANI